MAELNILDVIQYMNVVTSEHRLKPKYMDLVKTVLTPLIDMSKCLSDFNYYFDINFATGDQLDFIGSIVGVDREVDFVLEDGTQILNDEDYRVLIKAKIAKNHWDGTTKSIFDIWNSLFNDIALNIVDNMDMTCLVFVNSYSLTPNQISMFFADLLVPRPSGVQYFYYFAEGAFFSFDYDTTWFKGWDEGHWVTF